MGMFDFVKLVCECPNCHALVTEFQTKDTDCNLETVSIFDPHLTRCYSVCTGCGLWVEVTFKKLATRKARITAYDNPSRTPMTKVVSKKVKLTNSLLETG